MSAKIAFVVLGMHRSGTSSVAGTLARLGAARPRHEMEAADDNPRGFFESRLIGELNDRILEAGGSWWSDWRRFDPAGLEPSVLADFREEIAQTLRQEFDGAPTLVLKDPRLCRLGGVWSGVLESLGYRRIDLLPLRSPMEVAGSLQARNGMDVAQGLALWLRHVLDAERDTRGGARLLLPWNDFMRDWRGALAPLTALTGEPLDLSRAPEIESYLSLGLRNQVVADETLATAPENHAWATEAYACLVSAARGDGEKAALTRLDHIRDRFETASDLFGRAVAADLRRARESEGVGPSTAERADYLRSLEGLKALLDMERQTTEAMRVERDAARDAAGSAVAVAEERRRIYEERLRRSTRALIRNG
ncbi:sulfotransferase family protein [Brevundimonas sp. VNH65]|uniref:sulfotransferase family protein n=1 Tax=Brevundimonas sp. VNH65 TaxID=3400917 RepID=UPI003BFB62E2